MPGGAPEDVATLLARVRQVAPELADAPYEVLGEGWDSVALDVAGEWIFKFPRSARAEASLLREVDFLKAIVPRVRMRLPELVLHEREGAPFSQHRKIPGTHLLAADYQRLDEDQRNRLARQLADLHADLHAIRVSVMEGAGAGPVEAFPSPDWIEERIGQLPSRLMTYARDIIESWREELTCEEDLVFGQFDGHGWNMAFDHDVGVLNGVYDFADAGIGERHRDFSSTNWIDPDLTERVIAHYGAQTGIAVDRRRVDLYTAVLRLWEHLGEDEIPSSLTSLEAWAEYEASRAADL
ncbi:phosphotransferase family protein [Devosia nitrariae]|uniref:Aminoglycoside phosphotransferase domain-containing protein n=1 Tax=Devosia nitrariae TaxID=2071872 RepID=A0ABQ5WCF8_9HYPH|nr:aminoglycoside phosphotransferase family protein [Devosia nitrariae]GLQ57630.1 hypothetical protein GCM10010862_48890 [Devosia nitrariae]